jgi:pimeloyl-ACP methyl ester carboxylesterase
MNCAEKFCEGLMNQEKFHLQLEDRIISGVLHLCETRAPAVITCHGLFSNKQSDKFLHIAEAFSGAGCAVVRFDFSGCGESTGDIADTTVTRRLQELKAVVLHIAGHAKLAGQYGILGSSLGGYVGLLHAARHPVAALSVWSAPSELLSLKRSIPPADVQKLKADFFSDACRWNLTAEIADLQCVQVIHGKEDEIVPWQHAELIHRTVRNPRELLLLPGADHSISQPQQRQRAITQSLAWFKRHLL